MLVAAACIASFLFGVAFTCIAGVMLAPKAVKLPW